MRRNSKILLFWTKVESQGKICRTFWFEEIMIANLVVYLVKHMNLVVWIEQTISRTKLELR